MIGRPGAYADAPAPSGNAGQQIIDLLPVVGQTVGGILQASQDPVQRLGVLRAELNEALRLGRPESTIREIQAKIQAAERDVALEVEWEAQQRRVGTLVEVGLAAGSLFLIALAGSAVLRALR